MRLLQYRYVAGEAFRIRIFQRRRVEDARTYASWGIDYVKYDWCNTPSMNPEAACTTMRDAGPGHWNDMDMLEVCNGMSEDEDRAHLSIWPMTASPLN
jgi:hypothetical protein